jgi:hypothetical protein
MSLAVKVANLVWINGSAIDRFVAAPWSGCFGGHGG